MARDLHLLVESPMGDPCLNFLGVGTGKAARRIAVRRRAGAEPALLWLGGFKSDMEGTKAEALHHWASEQGRGMVRFDFSGHGESGGEFTEGTIGRWLEDSLSVWNAFCRGNQVLIGSSMGAWLALLLTREVVARQSTDARVTGLVLIAPAVDFTEELFWKRLAPEARRAIEQSGCWMRPSQYSPQPY